MDKELEQGISTIDSLLNHYLSLSKGDDINSQEAIDAYLDWYSKSSVLFHRYFDENDINLKKFDSIDNSGNGYSLRDNYQNIATTYALLIDKLQLLERNVVNKAINSDYTQKSPMVFISHSTKDKDFVEALVNLLEDLGMNRDNVFCSSVDGYGVGLSKDIFETLRSLFEEHELFVMFIHSPRYYESAVSLNEMGAAWVLKSEFCSFLTKDMDFSGMVGVIDGKTLSLKVDNEDAPARLNELKNQLIGLFNLSPIDETKWERKRNQFLNTVRNLKYTQDQEQQAKVQVHRAIIRAYSEKVKSGLRSVTIRNEGNATAVNLKVSIDEGESWITHPSLPKIYDELLPKTQRNITFFLIEGQDEATLHFSWDDESQEGNTLKQTIDL